MNVFITGTDTGVGKTQTAVQLLRLLGVATATNADILQEIIDVPLVLDYWKR